MAKRIIVPREDKIQKQKQYLDVILTDFTLDVTKPRKPKSFGRMVSLVTKNKKRGRAFTSDLEDLGNYRKEFVFDLGPEFEKLEEKATSEGKILRVLYPRSGVSIFADKSTTEFIKARKTKIYN